MGAYDKWIILGFVGGMKGVERGLERTEDDGGYAGSVVSGLMAVGTSFDVSSMAFGVPSEGRKND